MTDPTTTPAFRQAVEAIKEALFMHSTGCFAHLAPSAPCTPEEEAARARDAEVFLAPRLAFLAAMEAALRARCQRIKALTGNDLSHVFDAEP